MSVYGQIIKQLDRLAIGRQSSRDNYNGGTDFWALVDAAQDETYENAVETVDMTAIDTMLAAGTSWANTTLRKWFSSHEAYFVGQGYAASGGAPALASYLAAVGGGRVPFDAAQALNEALGTTVPAFRIFPKGTLVANEDNPANAGMHLFGTFTATSTWAESAGALASTVGPAAALCINSAGSQTVGGTFRCTNFVASTYKDLALSLSTAAQYTQTVLGEEALGSGVSAGDSSLPVADTSAFTAGEYVLIWESDTLQEVVLVDSLVTNTSIETSTNLLNAYTTSAVIWPLFSNVAYQSGGSGTGAVTVYARPDRILAL